MYRILLSAIILLLLLSCNPKSDNDSRLLKLKRLDHYPSASGIEFVDNNIYIIGDDAKDILVLNADLTPKDSIPLYKYTEKRLPKDTKADLESISLIDGNKSLLLLGSGSGKYRNHGWVINLHDKSKDSLRLGPLYERLLQKGLKEINIEGGCAMGDKVILSNRGHKAWPENYLIITDQNFWNDTSVADPTILKVDGSSDNTSFSGISGITYTKEIDRLIMTVSTEDTRSAYEDGAIGKSYFWIINEFSKKVKGNSIRPDHIIDLESIDLRFKGQKIESVCILSEKENVFELLLAADNDDGSSTIFKLVINLKSLEL